MFSLLTYLELFFCISLDILCDITTNFYCGSYKYVDLPFYKANPYATLDASIEEFSRLNALIHVEEVCSESFFLCLNQDSQDLGIRLTSDAEILSKVKLILMSKE